jgi:hypothetical protein
MHRAFWAQLCAPDGVPRRHHLRSGGLAGVMVYWKLSLPISSKARSSRAGLGLSAALARNGEQGGAPLRVVFDSPPAPSAPTLDPLAWLQAPDGCGGYLDCGKCNNGTTCSMDGKECVAGPCVPATFCSGDRVCGTQPNGCGGDILCGVCPAEQQCTPDGRSCEPEKKACVPQPCPASKACGLSPDGCGEPPVGERVRTQHLGCVAWDDFGWPSGRFQPPYAASY